MKTIRSGFTLLELMIGLVIVTVLASIAVPSFSKAIEKTKVKDAENVLAAIYSSEKIYRLDQSSYGSLAQLVAGNYVSDPDPGNTNTNWDFTTSGVGAGAFTATATRTGGRYNGQTIAVNQNFNGATYNGNHPLRDS